MQHIAAQRHPSLINEVADDNAAEQHAADAKADTPHLDVADPQSDNRHQRQNADRQCYITHFLFPVNNISIYMDYDWTVQAYMQDGAHSHAAETVKHPYDGRFFPLFSSS